MRSGSIGQPGSCCRRGRPAVDIEGPVTAIPRPPIPNAFRTSGNVLVECGAHGPTFDGERAGRWMGWRTRSRRRARCFTGIGAN